MDPRQKFDEQIDAAISENLRNTHYGRVLAAQGIPVVTLDDDGKIVEYEPGGTIDETDTP